MGGTSVLVVDDDPGVAHAYAKCLRTFGCTVMTAFDALEALDTLDRGFSPDILVTDVLMPRMDGRQLQAEIAKRYPRLRVILVTAHGSIPDGVAAVKEGASDYLEKPVDLLHLAQAIQSAARAERPQTPKAPDLPPAPARERQAPFVDRAVAFLKRHGATGREVDVFLLTRQGLKALAVACELGISENTVYHHLNGLYVRVGVHGFNELQAMIERVLAEGVAE